MLQYCKQHEVPVIMSSDAHTAYDIGNHVYVKDIIKRSDVPRRFGSESFERNLASDDRESQKKHFIKILLDFH